MSDCVIIPTIIEEAFGLVAIEALSCAKPVIATNSGGLLDIVDNNCGFIFSKENFENELLNILKNVKIEELKEKGEKGYKVVINNKEYNSKNYLDYFDSLIEKESGE